MGRSKISVKYINKLPPQNLGEIFSNADESDLKILLALMMAANESGEIAEDFSVSAALNISESEVAASLKFWCGAGIITTSRVAKNAEEAKSAKETSNGKSKPAPMHRNGVVEPLDDFSNYGSDALASLLEKRAVSAELINESQRVFGKMFNSYDAGVIVWLVNELKLDDESVLALLAYAARMGKRNLKYVEKLAMSFYDDGYVTAQAIADRINIIENSRETITKIKKLFGVGSRALTTTERTLFEKWTQKFEYGIDVITHAYDITVDKTKEPAPKYTNAILENWYAAELHTLDEIKEYEAAKKGEASSSDAGKSYNLDDFYEAAFKRSLQDLK